MRILDQRETFTCRFCGEKCFHSARATGNIGGTYFKTYSLLVCERCDHPSLMTKFSEEPGGESGDSEVKEILHYPPLIFRRKPEWYDDLPDDYKIVLNEVYDAVDAKLFILASSGVRTAIDRLLSAELGDIGSFHKKLKTLLEKETIKTEEHELLEAIIDAGSASIHRGFSPDNEAIKSMLEITEHIFYELCIRSKKTNKLKSLAENLKNITPKRSV